MELKVESAEAVASRVVVAARAMAWVLLWHSAAIWPGLPQNMQELVLRQCLHSSGVSLLSLPKIPDRSGPALAALAPDPLAADLDLDLPDLDELVIEA